MRIKNLLIVIVLLSQPIQLFAKDYYFSSTTGSDTYTKKQAQHPETPWKTISKLNKISASLVAGDRILFKRGDRFIGAIRVKTSGTTARPIEFTSYGSGEAPIIDGRISLSSWKNIGDNMWEASHASLKSRPTALTINNALQAIGRHPNRDAENSGYWTIDSHTDDFGTDNPRTEDFTITSSSLTDAYNWENAEIVIRASHWMLDKTSVKEHTGNTVIFSNKKVTKIRDKYGFFFQNTPAALDLEGEWCYIASSKKIVLYSKTNPSDSNVKVSNINYLVDLERKSNIVIDGLKFTGSKLASVRMKDTANCTIRNCVFQKSGRYDILIGKRWNQFQTEGIQISNNEFSLSQGSSIEGGGKNISITKNTFTDIATVAGMGPSGNGYLGLHVNADGFLLEKNSFVRTGYMPMHLAASSNAIIKNNFIDTYCMVVDDGAGIYLYTGKTSYKPVNRKVTDNIVLNGIGAPDGTKPTNYISAEGIYFDDNSKDIVAEGNTIAFVPGHGIYYHNAHHCTAKNNTIYSTKNAVNFQTDKINNANVINNVVTNNIVVSTGAYEDELMFRYVNYRSNKGGVAGLKAIGTVDNNYYCVPYASDASFKSFRKTYNLTSWQNYSAFDKNSILSPVTFESFDVNEHIRFEYNATETSMTFNADQNYVTPDGNTFSKGDEITIRSFGSIVLLKDLKRED